MECAKFFNTLLNSDLHLIKGHLSKGFNTLLTDYNIDK